MDFRGIKEFFKDTFKYIIVIVVVLFIVIYIISFQQIMGPSMNKTLTEGDIVVVNKFVYNFNKINHNEVVVLKSKEKTFVKRIIGLPGEHIEYKNNILYVDGKAYKEEFTSSDTNDFKLEDLGYDKIPNDMYLVLGDNRSNSEDGRDFGLIKKKDIIGKASIRIWPLNKMKFIN